MVLAKQSNATHNQFNIGVAGLQILISLLSYVMVWSSYLIHLIAPSPRLSS